LKKTYQNIFKSKEKKKSTVPKGLFMRNWQSQLPLRRPFEKTGVDSILKPQVELMR